VQHEGHCKKHQLFFCHNESVSLVIFYNFWVMNPMPKTKNLFLAILIVIVSLIFFKFKKKLYLKAIKTYLANYRKIHELWKFSIVENVLVCNQYFSIFYFLKFHLFQNNVLIYFNSKFYIWIIYIIFSSFTCKCNINFGL